MEFYMQSYNPAIEFLTIQFIIQQYVTGNRFATKSDFRMVRQIRRLLAFQEADRYHY